MQLKMIGCNHRTADITARERFSFDPAQVVRLLQDWGDSFPTSEAVLLSTCNRTELYVATETSSEISDEALVEFFCRPKEIPIEWAKQSLFFLYDMDVVSHVFAVAGSLDSMVVGEPQILSQVKEAYQMADAKGVTGTMMHGLFQNAIKVAKRIINETEIHSRRVSIPSVAVVDFALQIFERLDDKSTLVLGAGEMADETLRYLSDHGASSILVINRNRERAWELAEKWHGIVDLWENRIARLVDVDIVISTTAATEPIVTRSDYLKIEPLRRGRPLFVLDLAMPRDFDPAIGERDNVFLYSIDDLKESCDRNMATRNRELPKAQKIIEQESERFVRDMYHRKTGNVIQQLRSDWEVQKETELKRLFNKLPNLSPEEQNEVCYAFDRLINKLLHPPLESLRNEASHGVPGFLLDAISRLFRLKD